MSTPADGIQRAFFKKKDDSDDKKIAVHFNPESLQYVIRNTLDNQGSGNSKKQYVSDSTGKLSLDILFDTTDTGEDVRAFTTQLAKLMEPGEEQVPPVVTFEWGTYSFDGMLDSYQETLNFFSSEGIPLRANLSLSMSSQEDVFDGGDSEMNSATGGNLAAPSSLPANTRNSKGLTDVASRAGNPDASRQLARANGEENIRFPNNQSVEVAPSNPATPTTAFSSANANGADHAGFSQLRKSSTKASQKFNLQKLQSAETSANFGVAGAAGVSADGTAGFNGAASLKADVGRAGNLQKRIQFSEG